MSFPLVICKRVSLIAENRYLDVKKDYKTTLKDLLKEYEKNFKYQTSYDSLKKYCLENFKEYFGEDTLVDFQIKLTKNI